MKRWMNIVCLLMAMVCLGGATLSAAPGDNNAKRTKPSIRGVVYDEYGTPLPGASVLLVGTMLGAGTNANGEFVVNVEESKNYKVQVSFVGYDPYTVEVKSSTNPQPITVNLKLAANEMNEIVVTGSFIEKPLKEVPVLTRVISTKDIQALNPMNFETLLQYELPGLQIGYNSMSQLPEITYQGMDGEYMLFLIDGERVSGEGADHNVDFTRFNVDDIERIEVVKGAQSTIYGSNALGGVINIITKTASRPITASVNGRYAGSYGRNYNASLGLKKDRFTSYTSWSYRTRDTYTVGDTEGKTTVTEGADGSVVASETASASSTTVWGYNIWDFTQKFGYTFSEKLSADVKGTYYWNQRDIRTGRLYQEYYVDYALNAKMKYLIDDKQQLVLGYMYDNYKKDHHYFRLDSTYTNYRNVKQTPRLDYTGRFGDHTVSAGFEGDIEYLHHYMLADSSSVSNAAYAFYGQEDWNVTERFNVVLGLRGDYHEKYKWHVTPKVSLMYRLTDLTFRGGFAQGFRSPSLKELYEEYDMGGMGYFMIYGNENLKPETSNQWSLSSEYNKGGFNASASFAHNRFKNKIEYTYIASDNSSGYSDMQYYNSENARTTSLEGIVRYRFDFGLMLTGSYVFTDDYTEVVEGKNASLVRPHMATFSAMYNKRFGKLGFNAALNGQWASAFDTWVASSSVEDGYEKTSYNSRTVISANAGLTFPRGVSLTLGVDNLLNYKDKSADSSLQVPQNGINFVGTLNINLGDMFKL